MSTHRITPIISNDERYNKLRALLTEIIVIDEKHRLDLLEGGYEQLAALFRQEAGHTSDLARLSEAAAKESCVVLCFDSPYVLHKLSAIITRHFKSMAQEVAEARSKETGYQKAIDNYDDWVKRRTETVDALRAENERLRKERDAGLEMVDALLRGFERSLCRIKAGDKDGALRELELAQIQIDRDYSGKTMSALRARVAELEQDRERITKAAEEVLQSFIISKKVEAGHPCPENMVICRELRAAIDSARHPDEQKEGGKA